MEVPLYRWMVFVWENPMKLDDDWGYLYFGKPPNGNIGEHHPTNGDMFRVSRFYVFYGISPAEKGDVSRANAPSHQNSWDLWIFIAPRNSGSIGFDPSPHEACLKIAQWPPNKKAMVWKHLPSVVTLFSFSVATPLPTISSISVVEQETPLLLHLLGEDGTYLLWQFFPIHFGGHLGS